MMNESPRATTGDVDPAVRRIVHRTKGSTRGPITRLMSPGDLGEAVKPFVFLDYFDSPGFEGPGFAPHPHSGLATHTTLIRGTFDYGDSTGRSGTLLAGNIEWMQAGGGVWHWGTPRPRQPTRGYQLWVALPASLEHAPAESHYIDTDRIESDGTVRVLLGSYGSLTSPIPYREDVTYLHVTLKDRERWTFQPSAGHDVAWLAVNRGALRFDSAVFENEMVVFEESNRAIPVRAIGETELVIASGRKHPHPLVCGYYSVHTTDAALVRGELEIEQISKSPAVLDAIRGRAR